MSRIILVTGATQGIGAAVAHHLAAQGWTVVCSGRNAERGEKVVQDIEAKGGRATFIAADISVKKDVESLHEKILQKYGQLDAAVNNAGISIAYGKFADLDPEAVETMLRVNVMAVFWCMSLQIKAMLERGKGGAIVNMSSSAGRMGLANNGFYSGTKHAVIGMTKSAALDYGKDNIRINAVAPAIVRTEMINQAVSAGAFEMEKLEAAHPIGKIGDTVDVAKAIAFLLDSPFATGSVVDIDGGCTAGMIGN